MFVVAIASAGDALFELIDIYTTGGSILIVLLALIAIVLVATGIAMLVRFISYNYIWYEYSNEEFSFYSGIISKKRAHVPLSAHPIDQSESNAVPAHCGSFAP